MSDDLSIVVQVRDAHALLFGHKKSDLREVHSKLIFNFTKVFNQDLNHETMLALQKAIGRLTGRYVDSALIYPVLKSNEAALSEGVESLMQKMANKDKDGTPITREIVKITGLEVYLGHVPPYLNFQLTVKTIQKACLASLVKFLYGYFDFLQGVDKKNVTQIFILGSSAFILPMFVEALQRPFLPRKVVFADRPPASSVLNRATYRFNVLLNQHEQGIRDAQVAAASAAAAVAALHDEAEEETEEDDDVI